MTTIAVLADPPRPGVALPEFVAADLLTDAEAADLYAAMLRDVCGQIERSGGDLLVNYRSADDVGGDPEAEIREAIAPAVPDADAVRFEVQVGSSFSARAGNTVTHLLETEEVQSAAVVEPTAAFLERRHVDSAAMKLRQADVVLGPSTDGRVYYAAFRDTMDFEDAFAAPTVETLTDRARDSGLSADHVEMLPVLERPSDLATVLPILRSAEHADRTAPEHTAAVVEELGLRTAIEDGRVTVPRD